MINIDKLKGSIPESVFSQLPETIQKFGITSILRLSHFLAQCAHESGEFKIVSENLNYSDVNRIVQIFKPEMDQNKDGVIEASELEHAKTFVKNPQALGNIAYANRNGNGNESSGDGYRFRGRGYIQLTGKSNYKAFSDFIGEDCVSNPDLVSTKYSLDSAAFFFQNRKIWQVCDLGSTPDVVEKVTKLVNGGTIGLAERQAEFLKFYNLLK